MTWVYMKEYVHIQILLFLLFKLRIGILLGSRSRLQTRCDLRSCFSRLTLDGSFNIACFSMKGSLVPDPFRKRSKSFSVGQPRTLCAYFACIFSVLYTVSMLILHPKCSSSLAITLCYPCYVFIKRMRSKLRACVLRI